jgi:hypothetical protein
MTSPARLATLPSNVVSSPNGFLELTNRSKRLVSGSAAAAQKRVAIQEFDKFNTKAIIAAAAAAAQENQRVPTKVTTVEQIN